MSKPSGLSICLGVAVRLTMVLFQTVVMIIALPIVYLNDWWEGLFDRDIKREKEKKRKEWELLNPREKRMMAFYEREEEQ